MLSRLLYRVEACKLSNYNSFQVFLYFELFSWVFCQGRVPKSSPLQLSRFISIKWQNIIVHLSCKKECGLANSCSACDALCNKVTNVEYYSTLSNLFNTNTFFHNIKQIHYFCFPCLLSSSTHSPTKTYTFSFAKERELNK